MIVNGYFAFYAEPMRNVAFTSAAPFANVIFLLFLLTASNALLARVVPRLALTAADLIAVYVMLSIQTGLGDTRALHSLISTIAGGYWGATPSNRWALNWLPHLPQWLMITDVEALRGYFLGNSTRSSRPSSSVPAAR
jgi:hypothetical protein